MTNEEMILTEEQGKELPEVTETEKALPSTKTRKKALPKATNASKALPPIIHEENVIRIGDDYVEVKLQN